MTLLGRVAPCQPVPQLSVLRPELPGFDRERHEPLDVLAVLAVQFACSGLCAAVLLKERLIRRSRAEFAPAGDDDVHVLDEELGE